MIRIAALALGLVLALPSAATELDAAAQARAGVQLATLRMATAPISVGATAEVLDPTALVEQFGKLDATRAAVDAAAAEVSRTRALLKANGNASRKALEAAQARLAAEQAGLRNAQVSVRLAWGAHLAGLAPDARRALLDAWVRGDRVLLRAEPLRPPPGDFRPNAATLQWAGGNARAAQPIGRLPQSQSGLAPGWLLQADGTGLAPGMVMSARLDGADTTQGVLLPLSAIVRWNGLDWAYVASGPGHFERRAVRPRAITTQGWVVAAPFRAGERVVTRGAEILLAVDAAPMPGAAAPAGDDDD